MIFNLRAQSFEKKIDSINIIYDNKKYEKGIKYINSFIDNYKNDQNKLYKLNYHLYHYQYKLNKTESIKYLYKAKKHYKKLSELNKIDLNYHLGYVSYWLKRYDSSTFYLKNSEKINSNKKILDSSILGKTYQRLAYVYSKISLDTLELNYLKKSINLYESLSNNPKLIYLYNNLGTFYSQNNKKLDSSFYYYKKGLNLKIDHKLKGTIYQNIGALYFGNNISLDSAKYYFDKALKYNLGDATYASLYFNKAVIEKENGNLTKALEYYNKSNEFSIANNNLHSQSYIQEDLAKLYDSIKNFKKANEHYKKYISLKDSILKLDIIESVNDIETKYQTEKKEKENLKLKAQNIEAEAERQKNKIFLTVSLLFIVLGGTIGLLSLKNSKRKRKLAEQDKELETQKNLTLLKEQELTTINAMVDGQEKERKRIAEDLHDNLGSVLATLKLHFENLKMNREKKKINQETLFDKTENLIDEAYLKVRRIAHAKNAGVIANQGLLTAIQMMAEKISSADKVKIEVVDFGLDKRLENSLEITIFRIIQELLTNIMKHAEAKNATINISLYDKNLNIIIEDDGKGFDLKKVNLKNGMGISSIKTRVEHLKGTFEVDATIGKGSSIIIDIPID